MRILALVTDAFGGSGGIAQFNKDFLRACGQSDHTDEILVLPRVGAAPEPLKLPETVVQLEPQRSRLRYGWTALQLMIRRGPFDVIFCGHLNLAPLAALLARLFNSRLWLQLHGIEAWSVPKAHVRWAAEQADFITAVSRYTRRRFLSWANVTPERVRVLPNTVRPIFSSGPKPPETLSRYDLNDCKVLLTVGRMRISEGYKGHERVLAALPGLLERVPNIRYVIAGDGDDRARLERLVNKEGLNEVVRFIGEVPETDLSNLYRAADILVMPSTGEGFGIVFLEAAACGTQVIGGNQDGSLDALADGELGIAIDPDDTEALENAVVQALIRETNVKKDVSRFCFENYAHRVSLLLNTPLPEQRLFR